MPAPHATHVRFGARGDRLVANYHSDHAYVFDTTRSASPGAVAGAFPTGFIRSCRGTPLPPVIRPPGKRKAELEPCRCVAHSSGHGALFGHVSEDLRGNEGLTGPVVEVVSICHALQHFKPKGLSQLAHPRIACKCTDRRLVSALLPRAWLLAVVP